jgi:hypothetical protein
MNARIALCLLVGGLANMSAVVESTMEVTEVMINTQKATNSSTQWFEVHNTDATPVCLNNWWLEYHVNGVSVNMIAIKTHKIVKPFGYFVIGNNVNSSTNGGVHIDYHVDVGATFPKDGGGYNFVAILSPAFDQHDTFRWSTHNPELPGLDYDFVPGASMAKVNALDREERVSNWSPSTSRINCKRGADKGTPGKSNSVACRATAPTHAPTKAPKRLDWFSG